MVDRDDSIAVEGAIDLFGSSGTGPLLGMASTDLNATLLSWPPGHEVAEHVNGELDVLCLGGSLGRRGIRSDAR